MHNKYEVISFVLRAKNRLEIIKQLKEGNKTATNIAKGTKMYKSHVSRALKDLMNEGLIECLNPNDRDYKFYRLTRRCKILLSEFKC